MLNRHAVGPVRMPELMVAALDSDPPPARRFELSDDRPAVHRTNDAGRANEGQTTDGPQVRL
jgi:hypothetical protein